MVLKVPLLYQENVIAKVAINATSGTTRPMTIGDVIMQGTVWESLFCPATMNKLGKLVYSMPEMMYKYKGVPIPPLGMIDDVITVTNVNQTTDMNKLMNTLMDPKNLRLSKKKFFRIHIGNGHQNCPDVKVLDEQMKDANSDKYLGDIIHTNGTIQATIENRKKKGGKIIAEILSIFNEIPLGKHKTEVAIKLPEALLTAISEVQ